VKAGKIREYVKGLKNIYFIDCIFINKAVKPYPFTVEKEGEGTDSPQIGAAI
jgi:hypothetical protein